MGATNSTAQISALGGVEFELCGYVEACCETSPAGPPRVEGIHVGQSCRTLHFLHTCLSPPDCNDGAQVGAYVVHYAEGTQEVIPLVYGDHVRTWSDVASDLGQASEAWRGLNDNGDFVRLLKFSWRNPHPDLQIQTIDCLASRVEIHPILFALTAER
jgi:hypothetical protein